KQQRIARPDAPGEETRAAERNRSSSGIIHKQKLRDRQSDSELLQLFSLNGSISIGVAQDAPRPRKSLPRLAMAFRAYPRRDNHVLGLETTAPALNLKNRRSFDRSGKRIVCRKMAL